jgi:hypothetical protein
MAYAGPPRFLVGGGFRVLDLFLSLHEFDFFKPVVLKG